MTSTSLQNMLQKLSAGNTQRSVQFESLFSREREREKKMLWLTLPTSKYQKNNFNLVLENTAEKRWKGWGLCYSSLTFSVPHYQLPFNGMAAPCGVQSWMNAQEASNCTPTYNHKLNI